ncbi:hypothetical protein ACFQ3C_05695 [Seohaeicola saemankumensis]|uniref:DUF485 domain-containing protein n=1 Tax=Seohaeicola saemankumensis TaxID=481181 RepID=A0ABW3TBM4_9RHOB
MKEKSTPVFLERRSYRQRRLTDAARLLPVLGALLWLVPLLWPRSQPAATPDVAAVSTSSAILYMFGVWTFLALMALFLSVMLDANAEAQDVGDD